MIVLSPNNEKPVEYCKYGGNDYNDDGMNNRCEGLCLDVRVQVDCKQ